MPPAESVYIRGTWYSNSTSDSKVSLYLGALSEDSPHPDLSWHLEAQVQSGAMKVPPRTETHIVIPAWAQRGLQQDLVQTPPSKGLVCNSEGLGLVLPARD